MGKGNKKYIELFAVIHNMYLFYSKTGVSIWDTKSRNIQMKQAVREYEKIIPTINHEEIIN